MWVFFMKSGSIDITNLSGGIDLFHTLESGQSYLWRRVDGEPYGENSATTWYETGIGETAVQIQERSDSIAWRSNTNASEMIAQILRLDDDLCEIYGAMPNDSVIQAACNRFSGMRLVNDPVFPCLISFICSTQMRVPRIHRMQQSLIKTFGTPLDLGTQTINAYPTPAAIAASDESTLRDLGLGYRAPYVLETATMVANGHDPSRASELPYEQARSYLTQYPGVGEKVADCVLLFSLGFLEAVPLDTWIQTAIETEFPDCAKDSYAKTSAAIRNRLGGDIAGYTQTYLFHYLRTRDGL